MPLQNVEPPTEWGKDLGDPVAVIRAEPEELTRELGLQFVRGHDDLDFLRLAAVSLNDGHPFLLVRHEGKPDAGTEIISATAPSRELSNELTRLLHALHVGPGHVVWTHPRITLAPDRGLRRSSSRSALARGKSVPRKSGVRVIDARAGVARKKRPRSRRAAR
jgi:hypothetical protein